MSTWQEELAWWMGHPNDHAQLPTGWPGVPLNEIKARMLRTVRMPYDEVVAAQYRATICKLERGLPLSAWANPRPDLSGVYRALALAHEFDGVSVGRFLQHLDVQSGAEREAELRAFAASKEAAYAERCAAAGITPPWQPPWSDHTGYPV